LLLPVLLKSASKPVAVLLLPGEPEHSVPGAQP